MKELAIFIGERVGELRTKWSITKGELALRIGKSNAFVSELENNKCGCTIQTLSRILDVFHLSWGAFFQEDLNLSAQEKQMISLMRSIPTNKQEDFIAFATCSVEKFK